MRCSPQERLWRGLLTRVDRGYVPDDSSNLVLNGLQSRFLRLVTVTLTLLVVHAILAATAVVISVLGIQAKTSARARTMATLLLGTVGVQTLVGDALYPIYLSHAKPVLRTLAAGQRSVADIFEVKEHLAFFALVFTIGAFALTRTEPKPTALLRVLFTCAHGAIVLVAALGLVVASVRTP